MSKAFYVAKGRERGQLFKIFLLIYLFFIIIFFLLERIYFVFIYKMLTINCHFKKKITVFKPYLLIIHIKLFFYFLFSLFSSIFSSILRVFGFVFFNRASAS